MGANNFKFGVMLNEKKTVDEVIKRLRHMSNFVDLQMSNETLLNLDGGFFFCLGVSRSVEYSKIEYFRFFCVSN